MEIGRQGGWDTKREGDQGLSVAHRTSENEKLLAQKENLLDVTFLSPGNGKGIAFLLTIHSAWGVHY